MYSSVCSTKLENDVQNFKSLVLSISFNVNTVVLLFLMLY